MVFETNTAEWINIFIPATITKSNLTDLGNCFGKDIGLTAAVFNESWHPIADGNKTINVQDSTNAVLFCIYELDRDTDIKMEAKYGGTIIKIQIPQTLKGKKHYYRIRLDGKCTRSIQRASRPFDLILQSAFVQTDLVDFRLNDKRSLKNTSLLEQIITDGDCIFSKIHFFLMREAKDDYVYSDRQLNKSRRLEGESWKTYVGGSYCFDQIVAYDWKESKDVNDFTVFAKFKSFRSNWMTVIIFILGILIFGVVSGIFANLLYTAFGGTR